MPCNHPFIIMVKEESNDDIPGHEGHYPDPHHTGDADQGDHQESVAPDLVWLGPAPGLVRTELLPRVAILGVKKRGADPGLKTGIQVQ